LPIFSQYLPVALVGSLQVHDALHDEIRNFTSSHPEMFIERENSKLYIALVKSTRAHYNGSHHLDGNRVGLVVIVGLLTLGEGKLFAFPKLRRKTKRGARSTWGFSLTIL